MTAPVSSSGYATNSGVTTAASTNAGDNTGLSSQAFLQLLVAQLQYQDPSQPVDTSSFMQETATLTQVQTMESNSTATTGLLQAQQAQSAAALVGKSVSYLDANGNAQTGTVASATISATPPTLQIGSADIELSQIQKVLSS
ncbi:MAG: flgD [Frankiales bacterium]|nr:flgD [Frankiales bacterium]